MGTARLSRQNRIKIIHIHARPSDQLVGSGGRLPIALPMLSMRRSNPFHSFVCIFSKEDGSVVKSTIVLRRRKGLDMDSWYAEWTALKIATTSASRTTASASSRAKMIFIRVGVT